MERPIAVVIMVNSDNGKIIKELLLSVANEYELPGIEPDVKTVIQLSTEELLNYIGNYEMDEYGPLEISFDEDHLRMEAEFFDEPIHILPENDTLFFNRSNGTPIYFDLEEGLVSGFKVQGLQARKME